MNTSVPLAPAEEVKPLEIVDNLSFPERLVKATTMGHRWMGRKIHEEDHIRSIAGTVGGCCGAYILTKDWKIAGAGCPFGQAYAPFYDIRTGYDVERIREAAAKGLLPSHRESTIESLYGKEWGTKNILRDKSFLLFVEGRTHEEVIEYVYTEEFRKAYKIHGITFNDKDDGLMSAVWVDK